MIPDILFENETRAEATSKVVSLRSPHGKDEATLQVDMTGSGTVTVQGRIAPRLAWQNIHTITSSAIVPIARIAQMQLVTTGNTGAINAELLH